MKRHSVYVAEKGESLFTVQFDSWTRLDWNDDIPPFFKRLNKIKDDRSFVILATSVLEYQVDRYLKAFLPKPQILLNENTGFAFKIKIIQTFNHLPPQLVNFALLVNNIRNEFAHTLEIDRFTQAKKSSKLTGFLKQLDAYWNDYENDMTYYKIEPKTIQKFKDIWRVAIEGLRVYERNIKLFRQETEKSEFMDQLNSLSTKLKIDRERNELDQVMKPIYHGRNSSICR